MVLISLVVSVCKEIRITSKQLLLFGVPVEEKLISNKAAQAILDFHISRNRRFFFHSGIM